MGTEFRGIDLARLAEQIDQYASSVRSLTTQEDEAECERLLKSIASEMVKNSNLIHELLHPLTEEQKKIAVQAAEEEINDYDADDLLDIALANATDTHEQLYELYKQAKEEE